MRLLTGILLSSSSVTLGACFPDSLEPGARPNQAVVAASAGIRTILGNLGNPISEATAINTGGVIAGRSYDGTGDGFHAFRWQSGTMTAVIPESGVLSRATAVNDPGSIVGIRYTDLSPEQGFLWHGGTYELLYGLSTSYNPANTHAYAINSSGDIAGWGRYTSSLDGTRPLLWRGGVAQNLGSLPGNGSGEAHGINDLGDVVGVSSTHAFLWHAGVMKDLGVGVPGSYLQSIAYDINNSGVIVGTTYYPNVRATMWVNGRVRNLGVLNGDTQSQAAAINDNGQVVGWSEGTGTGVHPFVWYNGVMTNLGVLDGVTTSGMAYAINKAGQVAGSAGFGTGAVRWDLPRVNFWTSLPKHPLGLRGPAAAAAGGLLYVIGGFKTGTSLTAVQAYNPVTKTWTGKAPLPAARQPSNGAVALGTRIYVAGGQNAAGAPTATLFSYNTATNLWTGKPSMPLPGGCGGSAQIGGKLYVYSGCTLSGTGAQVTARLLFRYDPLTNAWTVLPSAPATHVNPAVAVLNGRLYVVGGSSTTSAPTQRVDVYDPTANVWLPKHWSNAPTVRKFAAGAVVSGRLYVIGGMGTTATLNRVESYDPVTDYWEARAVMPTTREALGVGVINGLIYAVGGSNSSGSLSTNERFTP